MFLNREVILCVCMMESFVLGWKDKTANLMVECFVLQKMNEVDPINISIKNSKANFGSLYIYGFTNAYFVNLAHSLFI